MKGKTCLALASRAIVTLAVLATAISIRGAIYVVTNWVNDPYCPDTNYFLSGASSASPSFVNNGVMRGSLYINSPIGTTLKLSNPGDVILFSGQVTLGGIVNPDGNMQFRFGLLLRGDRPGDTNWLGYLVGNPTGPGGAAETGLYVRNNPNKSNYAGGFPPNITRPRCEDRTYHREWGEGTYVFSISVSQYSADAQKITWHLAGVAPTSYIYSGIYTNTSKLTMPSDFDQVGFLGGAALFNSASTSNRISFKNLLVTYVPAGSEAMTAGEK